MQDLVQFLLKPIVGHPDDLRVDVTERDSAVILELHVHPDDLALLRGQDGQLLHAVQRVLGAAGGDRKPVLDLVDEDAEEDSEDSEDSSSDDSSSGDDEEGDEDGDDDDTA